MPVSVVFFRIVFIGVKIINQFRFNIQDLLLKKKPKVVVYFSKKRRAVFDDHRYSVKVMMTHRHDISKKIYNNFNLVGFKKVYIHAFRFIISHCCSAIRHRLLLLLCYL